ncbi:MAG: hypothetical protein KF770_08590 [Anaerolineae bacterium]|nr:hypothetical protein [Anaerolineae bacterium]
MINANYAGGQIRDTWQMRVVMAQPLPAHLLYLVRRYGNYWKGKQAKNKKRDHPILSTARVAFFYVLRQQLFFNK